MKRFMVLIVDDEKEMCISLAEILRSGGYTTVYTTEPRRVPTLLADNVIDLIIMDVRMPRVSGIDLLKRIREQSQSPPVIMISGYASVENAVLSMKYGAVNFYEKPLNTTALLTELNRLASAARTAAPEPGVDRLLVGAGMEQIRREIAQVAPTDAPVLLTGESGTGKELAACALHYGSSRCAGPFIKVNCASLPETLLESELFGHERGAFTDAVQQRLGKFETARGGTLFLDEIGDMSARVQPKLLRVLQDGEIQRLGDDAAIQTDVRLITATNQDMDTLISGNRFRQDLFYRLSVVVLSLPPLRQRREDIAPLTEHFLKRFNRTYGKTLHTLSTEVRAVFADHHWPGNIRELKNCLERAVIFAVPGREELDADLLPAQYRRLPRRTRGATLEEHSDNASREKILEALALSGGVKRKAAEILQIHRKTLYNKMKKLGLR
jgi:DNA-binding NtrC family response regulator